MKNNLTSRQMINVELAARANNKNAAKILKNHIPQEEQDSLKIAFNCECSDPDCKQRVLLSLEEYEKLHNDFARFVIAKGHNEPVVEKIEKSGKTVSVVKKYILS
jgi:hypothetical protein